MPSLHRTANLFKRINQCVQPGKKKPVINYRTTRKNLCKKLFCPIFLLLLEFKLVHLHALLCSFRFFALMASRLAAATVLRRPPLGLAPVLVVSGSMKSLALIGRIAAMIVDNMRVQLDMGWLFMPQSFLLHGR